jgi:hypothetical protein
MTLAAPIVRVLIALGVAAALGLACYVSGHSRGYASGQIECAKAQAKAASTAMTNAGAALAATRKVEDSHVRKTQKAQVVYRTIIKRVHDNETANPHYADCGLDADGVRIWNAAAAGTLDNAAGDADDGLRPAAAAPGATAEAGSAASGGERGRAAGDLR